ncbi:hypothetical protein FRC12_002123 [Ceratobasidium sp. 428]|nr:hypothetical protein FRC12_002123 [Ceratobasidium sp. 428]
MSQPRSPSPQSDISELQDSPFPNSKGPKSDAARLRHARDRVAKGGLEEANKLPYIDPQRLLPSRPKKRPRNSSASSSSSSSSIYQRIDAARRSIEENKLTMAEMVRIMCAFDYGDQRAKSDPSFQLSLAEAEDAQAVRAWAKELACQEILREGKGMEKHHLLNTKAKSFTVDSLKEWSPNVVYKHLCDHMPYFVSLLESFVKDGEHVTNTAHLCQYSIEHSSGTKQDEIPTTVSVVGSILWIKRSQRANFFAKGFTAYLYSSGVHAATINVINKLGLGVSYITVTPRQVHLAKYQATHLAGSGLPRRVSGARMLVLFDVQVPTVFGLYNRTTDDEPVCILPSPEVEALLAELRALLSTLPSSLPNLDINDYIYASFNGFISDPEVVEDRGEVGAVNTAFERIFGPRIGSLKIVDPVVLDDDEGDDWLSPQTQPVEADKPDVSARPKERDDLTIVDVGATALLDILSPASRGLETKKPNNALALVGVEKNQVHESNVDWD